MGSVPRKTIVNLIAVVLFAAVVRLYLPTTEHACVFDDYTYLIENARVQSGLTADGVRWAFTTTYASNWHPLTWLSHMLDVSIYARPAGHHLTSILLHALTTALLFVALLRMTGAVWRSAFAAAVFGLHPLHVESVAWLAERKDVLSGLFWVLAMLAYAWYTRRPKALRYALVVALYALGLMAKPMVLTLPIVLLLLDYWPLERRQETGNREQRGRERRPAGYLLLEKAPLVAMSAASAVMTVMAQESGRAVAGAASLPFSLRLSNAAVSCVVYIRKMLWPVDLAVYYPHPLRGLPLWQVSGSALVLIAITWAAIRYRKQAPYLLTGWLWYLVTMTPVIGLVQVGKQAMADRYMYLPMIGLLIAIAWGAQAVASGFERRENPNTRAACRDKVGVVLAGLALFAIALCVFQTNRQIGYWKNEVTLFGHALDVTRDNWMAHHGLARALDQRGKTDLAIDHYKRSIAIDPTNADVHNGLATAWLKTGKTEKAVAEFRKAIRLDPDNAAARLHYGVALDRQKRLGDAVTQFRKAAELAPDNPLVHQNLAGALARQGRFDEAIEHYAIACRLTGYSSVNALLDMAEACYQAGHKRQAVDAVSRAMRLARAAHRTALEDYLRGRLQVYERQ